MKSGINLPLRPKNEVGRAESELKQAVLPSELTPS